MYGFKKGAKPKSQHLADGGLVQNAAEYWSEDNRRFENTNPSVGSRVLRAVNPMTSLGSAMGAMHDSANTGDGVGMALAGAQAIPVFAAMKAVGPLVKSATGFIPSAAKTAAAVAGNTAFGASADMYRPDNQTTQNFANGGVVKGAGTGTSDDIKKEVAAGSYIMPADSTEQIGPESLQGLGFKPKQVPVNVSNGEYEMPPEQVHAVGVQALDQMKGATHQPVAEQNKGLKPEMYFANGGVVDPEKEWTGADTAKAAAIGSGAAAYGAARAVNGMNIPNVTATGGVPSAPVTAGQVVRGAMGSAVDSVKGFKPSGMPSGRLAKAGVIGALAATGLSTASTPTEQYRERFGLETKDPSLLGDIGVRTLGAASDLGNAATFGLAGKFYRDNPNAEQPPTTPVTAKSPAINPSAKIVPNPLVAGANTSTSAATQVAAGSPVDSTTPLANNVTRVGNSYSGGSVGQGFTVNGQSFGGNGVTSTNPQANSAQNIAAKQALFDRTPTLGEGQPAAQGFAPNGGRGVIIGQQENPLIEQSRKDAFRANSTVIQGARGLTSSQRAGLQAVGDKVDANNLSRDTTAANNAAQLTQAQMREQGANDRAQLNESGANYRSDSSLGQRAQEFGATSDLANREFNSGADSRGLVSQQARMTSKALAKYEAAKTPEERSSALADLQGLSGKNPQQDKFLLVGGGVDPATGMQNPQRLFNTSTQTFMDQQKAVSPIQSNPDAIKIKNDTSLSVEEKRKQLQALGY